VRIDPDQYPMATVPLPPTLRLGAALLRQLVGAVTQIVRGPRGSLQQVIWIKPILCALDCLNVRMASGVGCKMTLQCFFSK